MTVFISSVKLLSCVQIFAIPWTAARLPCPLPTPGAWSNSYTSSWWCHPTMSSSVVLFSSCLQSSKASVFYPVSFHRVSSMHQVAKVLELQLQHQSFQWISGLISFRMDWFDLLEIQGTPKILLQHHSSKVHILVALSFLYGPTLTSIHDYWKNHSFD